MKGYLDIVSRILKDGVWKKPVRRNADGSENILPYDTLALPNQVFTHNMSDGFPLLTTKKMPLKTILVELEGFIKGQTSKKWYQDRGCKIWNEWANPKIVQEELDSIDKETKDANGFSNKEYKLRIQAETDDLGPIYGRQWRNFGGHYGEWEFEDIGEPNAAGEYQTIDNRNGVDSGTDQLKTIVDTLHKNPYDRRMVCSAWNPNQIEMMALPPCHYAWNVTVIGDELNLAWVQRSCDVPIGIPFNIASYATLLLLLAKEGGFKPGNLTGLLVDAHIYSNQIKGVIEQLSRDLFPLPKLEIISKNDDFSIFNWEHTDVKLHNYISHGKVDFGDITV